MAAHFKTRFNLIVSPLMLVKQLGRLARDENGDEFLMRDEDEITFSIHEGTARLHVPMA